LKKTVTGDASGEAISHDLERIQHIVQVLDAVAFSNLFHACNVEDGLAGADRFRQFVNGLHVVGDVKRRLRGHYPICMCYCSLRSLDGL
jgi:hypothetical protein